MARQYHVAIAGATGAVGEEFRKLLEERPFPLASLRLLASERSKGKSLRFRGELIPVEVLGPESFEGCDIAFFSAGASRSREFGPAAVRSGAVVIDNSSAFRMDPEVPLVVPEINPEDIFLTDSTYNADVDGVVVRADTLAAVSGAVVLISGLRTTTDASGAFSLKGLPVGLGGTNQPVGKVTATGFEPKSLILDLPLGPTAPPDNLVNHLGEILVSPPVGSIPGGPFTVGGKVTLQGQTVHSGVTVTLIRVSDDVTLGSVLTNDAGAFGFWVPVGAYRVRAEKAGFATQAMTVTLTRLDQPVTANITLAPAP